MAATIEQAKEQGYVTTLFGRRRQIPELRARNYQVRTLGERLAVNTVIQGTAADVMKLAMIGVHRALARRRPAARGMILTIHDELLFEGPPEEADARRDARRARDDRAVGRAHPAAGRRRRRGPTWLEAK